MDVLKARVFKASVKHFIYIITESEDYHEQLRIARESISTELENRYVDINVTPIDTLEECEEPEITPHGDNPEDLTVEEIFELRDKMENSLIAELDKYPTDLLERVLAHRRNA
jgi:hypothetical protein